MKMATVRTCYILIGLFFIFTAYAGSLFAQVEWCGSDLLREQLFHSSPQTKQRQETADTDLYLLLSSGLKAKNRITPQTILSIPVVFHIIHQNGAENISDAQIAQGLADLNDAFHNRGNYKQPDGIDLEIEFCLAKQTPDGMPTTGITRTESPLTTVIIENQDLLLKAIQPWDPKQYLNIWIVKEIVSAYVGNGVAGYSVFPSSHGLPEDGIVVEARWFGSSPDNSKIHIHECGHYLGVYHTFEGGCKNNDCLNDGDRVADTPPDGSTQAVACGQLVNTCTSDEDDRSSNNPFRPKNLGGLGDQPDQYSNYMDYGDQKCQVFFTSGQKERMAYSLTRLRSSLLYSRGCYDPCPNPIAISFLASGVLVAVNTPVVFTNTSLAATGFQWLVDGVPFASTPNSTFTFSAKGKYVVTLIASNGNDACERRKDTTIVVTSQKGSLTSWKQLSGPLVVYTNNETNGVLEYKDATLWLGIDKVFLSEDSGVSWKERLRFVNTQIEEVYDIQFFDRNNGIVSPGADHIYLTNDKGNTWRKIQGPSGLYALTATMLDAPNQYVIGYSEITNSGGTSLIDVTFDNGATWQRTNINGVVITIRYQGNGLLYALVDNAWNLSSSVYTSTNFGRSWQTTGGTFDLDCFSFIVDPCDTNRIVVVNEDQYAFAHGLPKLTDIFVSADRGKSWSRTVPTNSLDPSGSIRTSPAGTYYLQSLDIGICRSTDQGMSWESIGGPSGQKDTRMVCPVDNNIVFAVDKNGAVWRTDNSGGDSLINSVTESILIITHDASTDTIGGSARMPIIIKGAATATSITLTLHFDKGLIYEGTYASDGTRLDDPASVSDDRAVITIPAKYFSDPTPPFALFTVIAGGGKVFPVSFDSAIVSYPSKTLLCEPERIAEINSASGIISAPEGCGTEIITDFMKSGKIPTLTISPNPATTSILISTSATLKDARVIISDVLGKQILATTHDITPQGFSIDLSSLASGIFFVAVESELIKLRSQVLLAR